MTAKPIKAGASTPKVPDIGELTQIHDSMKCLVRLLTHVPPETEGDVYPLICDIEDRLSRCLKGCAE